MKSIFKTSLYIMAFALAGIFFQISCSNSDSARLPASAGKLVYQRASASEPIQIWTSNYDGTAQSQLAVSLPANTELSIANSNRTSMKISPDGQKIFFIARNTTTNVYSICSCDFSGSNFQEVISGNPGEVLELGGLN